jgi:hypothetical protein
MNGGEIHAEWDRYLSSPGPHRATCPQFHLN